MRATRSLGAILERILPMLRRIISLSIVVAIFGVVTPSALAGSDCFKCVDVTNGFPQCSELPLGYPANGFTTCIQLVNGCTYYGPCQVDCTGYCGPDQQG